MLLATLSPEYLEKAQTEQLITGSRDQMRIAAQSRALNSNENFDVWASHGGNALTQDDLKALLGFDQAIPELSDGSLSDLSATHNEDAFDATVTQEEAQK